MDIVLTPAFISDTVCIGETSLGQNLSTAGIGSSISNYKWTIETDTVLFTNGFNYNFSDTGLYNVKLEITSNYGCKDSTDGTFFVSPYPDFNINNNVETCEFEEMLLQLDDTYNVDYLWQPNVGIEMLTNGNYKVSVDSLVNYNVIGTNKFGCASSDSFFCRGYTGV